MLQLQRSECHAAHNLTGAKIDGRFLCVLLRDYLTYRQSSNFRYAAGFVTNNLQKFITTASRQFLSCIIFDALM